MATISLRPVVLCDECLYDYALAADRPENGEQ